MNKLTAEERLVYEELKGHIATKLMVMMSIASDFLEIDRLGLWREEAASFDEFAANWGFSKAILTYLTESLGVQADVRGIFDPGILTKVDMVCPFINLETSERRRLAREVVKQGVPITPQLISDYKQRLFPDKARYD